MTDTPPAVEPQDERLTGDNEPHWIGKVILWFVGLGNTSVGLDRIDRWTAPPERCPWTALDHRCIWDAGHGGTCRTEELVRNVQTGRSFKRRRDYLGINYETRRWTGA